MVCLCYVSCYLRPSLFKRLTPRPEAHPLRLEYTLCLRQLWLEVHPAPIWHVTLWYLLRGILKIIFMLSHKSKDNVKYTNLLFDRRCLCICFCPVTSGACKKLMVCKILKQEKEKQTYLRDLTIQEFKHLTTSIQFILIFNK